MEKVSSHVDIQRDKVTSFYDHIGSVYDEQFESKAEHESPRILADLYKEFGIVDGTIEDIGCGTGQLKNYLGSTFEYKGIDLSEEMAKIAQQKGFDVSIGPAEEIIEQIPDKSVDHVTALSSLYFFPDIKQLIKDCERIAKKSIFLTFEQFDQELINVMKEKGIQLYNHDSGIVDNPDRVIKDILLWKRPQTGQEIYGDIVFKILDK